MFIYEILMKKSDEAIDYQELNYVKKPVSSMGFQSRKGQDDLDLWESKS